MVGMTSVHGIQGGEETISTSSVDLLQLRSLYYCIELPFAQYPFQSQGDIMLDLLFSIAPTSWNL
jgi:hypothetical protein